jgi:cytochrome c peroxidase
MASIYGGDLNKHAFKTPTIRNAAITAPYMHNGVFATLEQVIDFYNRGGGAGIGIELPNQTLPSDRLDLTANEQRSIITFIEALTDTVGITGRPSRLPSLADPKLDKRQIGGEY